MDEIFVLKCDTVLMDDHVSLTLSALCLASGAGLQQVHALVAEGLLQPTGQGPDDWRFSGDALLQARRALRLARDFDLPIPGVALVVDLLAEIERLRSHLGMR